MSQQKIIKGEAMADMLRVMSWLLLVAGLGTSSYFIKISGAIAFELALSAVISFMIFGAMATMLQHLIFIRKKLTEE